MSPAPRRGCPSRFHLPAPAQPSHLIPPSAPLKHHPVGPLPSLSPSRAPVSSPAECHRAVQAWPLQPHLSRSRRPGPPHAAAVITFHRLRALERQTCSRTFWRPAFLGSWPSAVFQGSDHVVPTAASVVTSPSIPLLHLVTSLTLTLLSPPCKDPGDCIGPNLRNPGRGRLGGLVR